MALLSTSSPSLDVIAQGVAEAVCAEHKLPKANLAIAIARLEDGKAETGDFQGEAIFYPASVVKVFYLAYAGHRIQQNKLVLTTELDRGLRDMIVDSSNDATNWVLEVLSGVSGGTELSPAELKKWQAKRQVVNRYFHPRGYQGLNASQKTWDWGPYGRERQGYGPNFELRNAMSANHGVKLLTDLATGKLDRAEWALAYLKRSIPADDPKATAQAANYIGKILPSGSQLWSKAGWTSEVKHDIALFQLPNQRRYALAIFTRDAGQVKDLIPQVARKVLEGLGEEARKEAL